MTSTFDDSEREDLGAMFAGVTRRLVDAETPILAARGLTMWEYVVLSHLIRHQGPNQLTLAREIRHDKTRLIALLEGLQARGWVRRERDPHDRRSQVVSITPAGRRIHADARGAIRRMEEQFLSVLEPEQQGALLAILPLLVPGPGREQLPTAW